MERRISLYVSRRNAVTWLSCVLLLAAAVLRIVLECTNAAICQNVWLEIVLPVAACILYILIVLLAGKEMFYKTAIPIWMIGLYHALQFADYNFGLLVNIFCWAILLFLAMLYTEITSGRGSRAIWLFFTNAAPPAVLLYLQREFVTSGNWYGLIPYLPDMLMGFGLMLIVFALRVHPVGEYHPTWGDRCDGRKIRTLDPLTQINAYFQVERTSCSTCSSFL